jgi:hypothetical protein
MNFFPNQVNFTSPKPIQTIDAPESLEAGYNSSIQQTSVSKPISNRGVRFYNKVVEEF